MKGYSKAHFTIAALGLAFFGLTIAEMTPATESLSNLHSSRAFDISYGIQAYANDLQKMTDSGIHWLDRARTDFFERIMASNTLSPDAKIGARCVELRSVTETTVEQARQVCTGLLKQRLL